MLIYGIYKYPECLLSGRKRVSPFRLHRYPYYLLAAFSPAYINSGYQDGTLLAMLISSRGMGLILEMNLGGKTVELLENICGCPVVGTGRKRWGGIAFCPLWPGCRSLKKKTSK